MIRKYIVCLILLITLPVISQEKPIGINNAGNTCFMNSALQCLYHSHDLTKLLNELPIDYYKDGTASRTYLNFLKTYKEYAAKNAVIESEIAKINWCVNLTQLIPLTDEEKRAGHTAKPFGATQDASELTVQLLEHLLINDINKIILKHFKNMVFHSINFLKVN